MQLTLSCDFIITRDESAVISPCSCGVCFSDSQEEARRHFNCPVLEGMELENQGGMGTELNHWEKRLLEVCSMFIFTNVTHAHDSVLCNVSL